MENNKCNCIESNRIDLVDYLSNLEYHPQKIKNNDYWYLSPLRDEKTPSFKVNRQLNFWLDFRKGKDGYLVHFGVQYFQASVSEFLTRIRNNNFYPLFFHPQMAGEKKNITVGRILIVMHSLGIKDISLIISRKDKSRYQLLKGFAKRLNSVSTTTKKIAIAFKNDADGYELRSECFKGSNSPNGVTTFTNNSDHISVFEGFYNFPSWQVLSSENNEEVVQGLSKIQTDFLVLNSLSFFDKTLQQMQKYRRSIFF